MELPYGYQKKFHNEAIEKNNRPGKPRSEWEEQLDQFASKLNPDRIKAGHKPYSRARIAKLLNNAGIHDAAAAYRFYRKIEIDAQNFGKLFDFLTKLKKA